MFIYEINILIILININYINIKIFKKRQEKTQSSCFYIEKEGTTYGLYPNFVLPSDIFKTLW